MKVKNKSKNAIQNNLVECIFSVGLPNIPLYLSKPNILADFIYSCYNLFK